MSEKEINPAFKFVAWAIPATILVIVPSFTDPINLPKLLALVAVATTATVLHVALRRYSRGNFYPRFSKSGVTAYALLALAMLVSGLLGGNNFTRIFFGATGRNNGLIYYVSVLVLALIIFTLSVGTSEISYVERTLSWTSLVFASYCWIQYLNLDPIDWANPYSRVIGTLGNPNFSSSALASFAVFWLYRFFRSNKNSIWSRVLYLIPALVMMLLSWTTDSIQGILVFAIGSSLILYIYVKEHTNSQILSYGLFITGGLALSFLFTSFLGLGPLGDALEQYTLKLRGWYAYFGLIGMVNSPLTGVGVDNYIEAFRMFKTESFVVQYGSALSSNNAHSTPVQIGASFGVIVFLLYCLIQFTILYKALKIINSKEVSQIHFKGIALVWILIYFQSLLSIEIIGLGVMNWVLGAIVLRVPPSGEPVPAEPTNHSKNKKRSKDQVLPAWTGALSIIALLLGSMPTIWIAREDQAYQKIAFGLISNDRGREVVQREYEKLGSLTLAYPDKVSKILDNMYQAGLDSEIENVLKHLYRMESHNAFAADLLATYYKDMGRFNSEVKVREILRDLDPWNEQLELALAITYSELGDYKKLMESVERLGFIKPGGPEYKQALLLLNDSTPVP